MSFKTAIDMGSSVTNIYRYGSGIVLSEPSVVAVDSLSGTIKAIGTDAKRLVGKTAENTTVVFPVFEGDISSEDLAAAMLSYFLKKAGIRGGGALIAAPCGADALLLDKHARVLSRCGINKTVFVFQPVLAALGQNVALSEFSPCFAIDIGGGVTDIAAFSLDGIIAGISMNIGGGNIDAHIIDFIAERYNLKIGLLTAERLKINAGSLLDNDMTGAVVNGRDILSGKPRSVNVTADVISPPVKIYIDKIIEYAGDVLAKLPAEVCAEIRHAGVYLSGGGAKLAGASGYFARRLGMEVNLASEPETAAIQGAGAVLNNQGLLNRIRVKLI